jgi:hypothetical protein
VHAAVAPERACLQHNAMSHTLVQVNLTTLTQNALHIIFICDACVWVCERGREGEREREREGGRARERERARARARASKRAREREPVIGAKLLD